MPRGECESARAPSVAWKATEPHCFDDSEQLHYESWSAGLHSNTMLFVYVDVDVDVLPKLLVCVFVLLTLLRLSM